jgi:hypothetical protein
VGACSPIDFIKEVTQLFMGVTCDHSLRGSQFFTMFYKYLLKKEVPLVVSDAPNPPKTGGISSYLFANLHKTESKQRQKMAKHTFEVSSIISRKAPKLIK